MSSRQHQIGVLPTEDHNRWNALTGESGQTPRGHGRRPQEAGTKLARRGSERSQGLALLWTLGLQRQKPHNFTDGITKGVMPTITTLRRQMFSSW